AASASKNEFRRLKAEYESASGRYKAAITELDNSSAEARRKLMEILKPDDPLTINVSHGKDVSGNTAFHPESEDHKKIDEATAFLSAISGGGVKYAVTLVHSQRAFFSGGISGFIKKP